jgi:hypothetical protein
MVEQMISLDYVKPVPYLFIKEEASKARTLFCKDRGTGRSNNRYRLGYKLLTPPNGNTKLSKSFVPTYGLSLAPHIMSGYNVCPKATKECSDSCLGKISGRSKFTTVQKSRIKKTQLLMQDPKIFFYNLLHELWLCHRKHGENNWAFRSNVISDINWSKLSPFIYTFTDKNYDYTKILDVYKNKLDDLHITFSYSGHNSNDCFYVLNNGGNVSVVCANKNYALKLGYFVFPDDPSKTKYAVVDGDISDERWLDPAGTVVLLKPKGKVIDSKFLVTMDKQ